MGMEQRQQMAQRVSLIRQQMAQAALQAGRRPEEILLLAASKTQSAQTVTVSAGLEIDLFGENRAQELVEKMEAGAYGGKPVHMIGHLQKNKAKYVVGRAALIHSVDSLELAQEINRQAVKRELVQDILLEVNLAGEQSKSGIPPQQLEELMEQVCRLPALRVRGLMAIPPVALEDGQNKPYFSALRQLFVDIKSKKYDNANMDCLSMGMSRDFRDAIAEGATLVRIGSAIYGPRS